MVDAKGGYLTCAHKLQNEFMGCVEHGTVFNTHANKVANGEEPPVVDFLVRKAPERQPISLLIEQVVQRLETGGIALPSVEDT